MGLQKMAYKLLFERSYIYICIDLIFSDAFNNQETRDSVGFLLKIHMGYF